MIYGLSTLTKQNHCLLTIDHGLNNKLIHGLWTIDHGLNNKLIHGLLTIDHGLNNKLQPMHLAYSAINAINSFAHPSDSLQHNQHYPDSDRDELMLRYLAYQTACNKYNREITAIQKYIPGWMPEFR